MTRPDATAAARITRSQRTIFLFWAPLAAQWIMMALEGPFLAAIIARMGDPAVNLAAYGVAFALAILVESPVIMLMSAATALVDDAESYRRLRNFANALNAGATVLLLLVLVPPVYNGLMFGLLGLPESVGARTYGALWLLLPWPAAIGYRRFLHGVLIRVGLTRRVAYGTVLRLAAMAAVAAALYIGTDLPGAYVGAIALSAGVCVEAAAARVMVAATVRRLLHDGATDTMAPAAATAAPVAGATAASVGGAAQSAQASVAEDAGAGTEEVTWRSRAEVPASAQAAAPGYGDIARFYYPLALTSFIGLAAHPLLTFYMGRAPAPLESLAVFPVVHSLSFVFRAAGFSYQEAVIALAGRRLENVGPLARFGLLMALASSGGMALVAFTPLAGFWFETVSGLPPELAAVAGVPTMIAVGLPALAVLLAFQQGVLVQARRTRAITYATVVEVLAIAALLFVLGWFTGMLGVTVAMLGLAGGRAAGNLVLAASVRRALGAASISPGHAG
jgi:progressive ankylosis protein